MTSWKSSLPPFHEECSGHQRKAVNQAAEETGRSRVTLPSLAPGEKNFSLNLNKLTKSSRPALGFISDNNVKLCEKCQTIRVAHFLLIRSWIAEVDPAHPS